VDKDRFISIIKDHQNLIYKICNSYCPNPEDRKDLQQEIMIQLWHSLKKFDGRVKISTWVYRIALNTAISFFRKDNRHKAATTSLDASVISLPDFEPDSRQDDKVALLYRLIEGLNELDRALMLLYLDDNSYRAMSEILGISETNVATRISRIKKNMRERVVTINT
jgi:RNA polymerase sigma-70 factor (ECF subfamily)